MSRFQYGSAMDDAEIAAFLEASGIGVLAFGTGEGGYALPMSFGYDAPNDRCIFQFAFAPDSRKRDYLAGDNPVTLVTYDWTGVDDWRSVVVHGTLDRVPPEEQHGRQARYAES